MFIYFHLPERQWERESSIHCFSSWMAAIARAGPHNLEENGWGLGDNLFRLGHTDTDCPEVIGKEENHIVPGCQSLFRASSHNEWSHSQLCHKWQSEHFGIYSPKRLSPRLPDAKVLGKAPEPTILYVHWCTIVCVAICQQCQGWRSASYLAQSQLLRKKKLKNGVNDATNIVKLKYRFT